MTDLCCQTQGPKAFAEILGNALGATMWRMCWHGRFWVIHVSVCESTVTITSLFIASIVVQLHDVLMGQSNWILYSSMSVVRC